jgi:TatA/E family protein of Tat protein translocase
MFGISFEHILIVGVILLLVGPKKLPELGNTMGKAIKNFKDSFAGVEEANFKRLEKEPTPESTSASTASTKSPSESSTQA